MLGIHTQTRPVIIQALWQYVKTHKLQDPHEREFINCDKYLQQVGGVCKVIDLLKFTFNFSDTFCFFLKHTKRSFSILLIWRIRAVVCAWSWNDRQSHSCPGEFLLLMLNSPSLYYSLCPCMDTHILSGSLTGFPVHFLLLCQDKQKNVDAKLTYEIYLRVGCLLTKTALWNVVKME